MRRAAILLALACGCDPTWAVRGQTLPGATVTVDCGVHDGALASGSTRAGADGHFELGAVGFLRKTCTVAVAAPGQPTRTFAVSRICAQWRDDDSCITAQVDAR